MDKKALALYMALGFEFAGLIIVTIYIGNWADKKYGLNGLGIAAGAIAGLVSWFVHFWAVMKSLQKGSSDEGDQPK